MRAHEAAFAIENEKGVVQQAALEISFSRCKKYSQMAIGGDRGDIGGPDIRDGFDPLEPECSCEGVAACRQLWRQDPLSGSIGRLQDGHLYSFAIDRKIVGLWRQVQKCDPGAGGH